MRRLWLLFVIVLLLGARAGLVKNEAFAEDAAPPEPPTQTQIQKWIRDLDSERYQTREDATAALLRGGYEAVGPVAQAASEAGLEVAIRAVYVLREAALSEDPRTADAAELALQNLSQTRSVAAPRAANTLVALAEMRQRRIRAYLAERGAKFQSTRPFLAQVDPFPDYFGLWLDQDWKGTDEDLAKLKFLANVTSVTFDGAKATDLWLRNLSEMPNVTSVTIKRAKITDEGLGELKQLPNLQELVIFFSPITDRSIDLLTHMNGLTSVKLYGLKFTKEGRESLAAAFANTATSCDIRGGAFLGISGNPHPAGCMVYFLREGSAAEKAGLQIGDIIVAYDGKKVKDFEALTALIADHGPGETAELSILRGPAELKKKVTLGAWE